MKLKEIKPGQNFKFVGNELVTSKFMMLKDGNVLNLSTLEAVNFKFGLGDSDVELVDNRTDIYHACREAFVCGQEKVPWHLVLHALREGLNMKEYQTYILQEKDYAEYPQLKLLLGYLHEASNHHPCNT